MEAKRITIIGAGTMGRGIAQLLAQFDVTVHIIEQNISVLSAAKEKIQEQFAVYKEFHFITEFEGNQALGRITVSDWLNITVLQNDSTIKPLLNRDF
ncbi:3-hydroxyacyl-CoA dehydrogenase NAD-binding domain-containing protein [Neobacillus jeddahensis]|uniref:3-hydroxyacyl-CoA dehydrogenase NAD-binding domain-containing protein n=1 Tax=Neobacillus jeddahensis TaxID=1461580 RepID=UPI00058DE0ED|nr:3-hydroxyacyl-CoA dehydrogenase NAD-binding domain-containing protein [Neobacillus jeddahensis]